MIQNVDTIDVRILPPNDGADSEIEAVDEETSLLMKQLTYVVRLPFISMLGDLEAEAAEKQAADEGPEAKKSRREKKPASKNAKSRKASLLLKRKVDRKMICFHKDCQKAIQSFWLIHNQNLLTKRSNIYLSRYDNGLFEYFIIQFELFAHCDKDVPSFSTSVDEIRSSLAYYCSLATILCLQRGTTGALPIIWRVQ